MLAMLAANFGALTSIIISVIPIMILIAVLKKFQEM